MNYIKKSLSALLITCSLCVQGVPAGIVIPSFDEAKIERLAEVYRKQEVYNTKIRTVVGWSAGACAAIGAVYLGYSVFNDFFRSSKKETINALNSARLKKFAAYIEGLGDSAYEKLLTFLKNEKKEAKKNIFVRAFKKVCVGGSSLAWSLGGSLLIQAGVANIAQAYSNKLPIMDFFNNHTLRWFVGNQTMLTTTLNSMVYAIRSSHCDRDYVQALVNAAIFDTEKVCAYMRYVHGSVDEKHEISHNLMTQYQLQFQKRIMTFIEYVISCVEKPTMSLDVLAMTCQVKLQEIQLFIDNFARAAGQGTKAWGA